LFTRHERRSAGVFSRSGRYFIYPDFKTTAGVYLDGEPVTILEHSVPVEVLGKTISEALSRYRTGLPHPEAPSDFEKLRQPVLEAAGAKSWVTFSKGALYCSISEEKKVMVLTPMRATRPPGAFEPVPEREVKLMLPATAAQIGAGVREALTHCE
jgi:hypothetical protein